MKIATLATVLVAGLLTASAVQAAEINSHTIKVGIGLSDDHPQGQSVAKFGELVAAEERRQAQGPAVRRRLARQRRHHDLGPPGRHAGDDGARHLDAGRHRGPRRTSA